MERENFSSRLGFILISAGCAIGIGNVWRFPYVAGYYGGGFFVLFYLLFLAAFGVPILTMELAMGRAAKASIACAYYKLEKPGTKWHIHGKIAWIGNYILLFFYTTVAGSDGKTGADDRVDACCCRDRSTGVQPWFTEWRGADHKMDDADPAWADRCPCDPQPDPVGSVGGRFLLSDPGS